MNSAGHADNQSRIRALLDRYERPLVRYAFQITHDLERARDVVQETLLRFCSDGAPRDDDRVAAWLFAVCRSRAIDACRKDRRMRPLTETQAVAFADESSPPDDGLERRDAASHVRRLLAGLSENQQEVLRLRFQSELSYRDIAQVTGLSISNVGYLIHTAIKTIRQRLGVQPAPDGRCLGGKS